MLEKINDYKGVILFYLLLALILVIVSNHNKQIDMHLSSSISCVSYYK